MKVSIIGSFRKYYEEIKQLVILLKKNNLDVLSPKVSEIASSIDDFVLFTADDPKHTPDEIQADTLNRILKSDVVYVYNPKGYVGRTTCYEIGVIRTTTIPLFFLDKPKDLPIMVSSSEIVKPTKLVYTLSVEKKFENVDSRIVIEKNKIKNEMRLKNIVICGSMDFYDQMSEMSEYIRKHGIPTVIPKEESMEKKTLSEKQFSAFKRKVSNQYLAKIRENSTYAILVVNQEKKGIGNYIGANTLVEISMAFCWGRRVYLLNDFYDPLMDELVAWNAISLKGNLSRLIEDYKRECYSLIDKEMLVLQESYDQLELGDVDEYFYPLFR